MTPAGAGPQPLLQIRDLTCRIAGREILRGVNLDVNEGETIVILGRSGCGKTTLLKCVNGLVATERGEIRFQGKPTSEWDTIEQRRKMGYVIQDGGLFPHWTVAANVGLVPKLEQWDAARIDERVRSLLDLVGLPAREYAARYPRELSGGQKQRVGIARALAADPPLLLLDEPFAALDPITRLRLQHEFRELRAAVRKTALFVTHDVREALMLASRVVLMKDGLIDLIAEPSEFVEARSAEAREFLAGLEEDWRKPYGSAPRA